MQSAVTFAVLALAAIANGQAAPPACAANCVATTPTSCSQSDISCLCHDNNFVTGATQCILTSCQGSDLQAAESFAQQLCEQVGVTLTSTPALPSSTGGSASGSASGSATGTDTASATQTGTPSGSPSGTAPGASNTAPSQSNTSAPASTTGAAATLNAGFTGAMGALLALFAL